MQVIIAEKPSVAREIAAIVGAKNRREGYIEGNGYVVTWAFGHLVQLAMPQQYGIEGFKAENLPILPPKFTLLPRQIRDGKEYKSDPGVLKQLSVIKELFNMADRIVVATDAGREGELIFRYIYSFLECRKPFVRLWISSLTDKAIREGLQNLRPGEEYDNLYLSAKARSEADWVVGINASQALAIAAGRGVWSLGRVQTPTLAIICSRYLENKAFEPATYFQLKLSTAKDATLFAALSTQRFNDKEAAQAAYATVMDADEVRVVTVEHKEVKEQPPCCTTSRHFRRMPTRATASRPTRPSVSRRRSTKRSTSPIPARARGTFPRTSPQKSARCSRPCGNIRSSVGRQPPYPARRSTVAASTTTR